MHLGYVPDAAFVRPYAERAIADLGYINPDRLDLFVATVIRLWNTNPRDYYWRREVETLTAEELAAFGLAKWARTPRAIIETLSVKGLTDPERTFETSFWHVLNAARGDMQKRRDLAVMYRRDGSRSPLWAGVKFMAAPQRPCAPAIALDGELLRDHPVLPLAECDREVCSCQWRLVTTAEARKEGWTVADIGDHDR